MQQQRILDVQRHQLSLFAAENNKLLGEARAQAKVEIRRRQAEQEACRSEMEYEKKILEESKRKKRDDRVMEQNALLATELDKEKAEEQGACGAVPGESSALTKGARAHSSH